MLFLVMQHIWKQRFPPTAFKYFASPKNPHDRSICRHTSVRLSEHAGGRSEIEQHHQTHPCVIIRHPRVENDERSSSLRGIRQQPTVATKVCWFVTLECRERTEPPRARFLSLTQFSQKEEALGFHLSVWEFLTSKEEVQMFFFTFGPWVTS